MIVAVYGAWYKERSGFACKGTLKEFSEAGKEVGRLLAKLKAKIVVTSIMPHTLDGYVTNGYLEELEHSNKQFFSSDPPIVMIKYHEQQSDGIEDLSDKNYEKIFLDHSEKITFEYSKGLLRFNRHLAGIRKADAIITIGGADHTFMAGQVVLLTGKPLIPIGSFGGASQSLLNDAYNIIDDPIKKASLGKLYGPWCPLISDVIKELLTRAHVAIIHGHSEDWRIVQKCINDFSREADDRIFPIVMKEINQGSEILTYKWEQVGGNATAAIAILTPDDIGFDRFQKNPLSRARQNVWLEIGYIWGKLGRHRLMLLVRDDVEIPSDFHGVLYYKYSNSPEERFKDICDFLKSTL